MARKLLEYIDHDGRDFRNDSQEIKKPFPAITNKTAIPRLIKPHEGSGVTPSSPDPSPPYKDGCRFQVPGFKSNTLRDSFRDQTKGRRSSRPVLSVP